MPVASSWIIARPTKDGGKRYRVLYRLGGRESKARYAGSFKTKTEAVERRRWVDGELAALRLPDVTALEREPARAPTLREAADRWRASRVDVTEGTRTLHRVALNRVLPLLGVRCVDQLEPSDVAELVGVLHAKGNTRETIRKSVTALAQVLDHAGVTPNPARDRVHVRLPREEREELNPPTGEHVRAVHALLPVRYRLPLLVLDATGMRVGELEALTWGDIDEPRSRWRVPQAVSKTGRARWVSVAPVLLEAVGGLVPRDDRVNERRVFQGFGADRFRTAITRACRAGGIPAFSPHDLRHRRISLLHLAGVPWARIGEHVGQRNLAVTANTYTHVLVDETELDYASLID
jgi:integrase